MTPLNVLIVDDESLARQRLIRLLDDLPEYRVCGEAEHGDQALTYVNNQQPDIVLLDIRMPGKDGLEVAEQLAQMAHPPAIVFCTAYDEYAINAFKFNAVGYLLKPVRREALKETLSRSSRITAAQLKALSLDNAEPQDATIVANTWQGQELIPLKDIYYISADHKYLNIVHTRGECISDQTLKKLESDYPETLLRIHRNALVNIHYIEALRKDNEGQHYIAIRNTDKRVTVSRRHVPDVKRWLAELQS